MIDKKAFKKTLADGLRVLGFQSYSNGWKYSTDELTIFFEPQKSSYDQTYFLNVYIRLTAGESAEDWHVNCRVERLLNIESSHLDLLKVDAAEWVPEDHESRLADFVKGEIVPKLNQLLTVDGLRQAWRSGQMKGCLVHRELKILFEMS